MKIYVASSWRNKYQPEVVRFLRAMEHDVYDFRQPLLGDNGFHWSEIGKDWQEWTPKEYIQALKNPIAERGFKTDMDALRNCDACVLVLPCGRSAHLEAGWGIGAGKKTIIYIPEPVEPELMYKMADAIVTELHHIQPALYDGHSMGRYIPCGACGDLDGCWNWRQGGNQFQV